MSSALVPGRIRLAAPVSVVLPLPESFPWSWYREKPGERDPTWSSAMGGGEGSRGDDDGELTDAMVSIRESSVECSSLHLSSFPFRDKVGGGGRW